MHTYTVEIKCYGLTEKYVTVEAPNASIATDKVSALYPVGPYEFVARKVE